MKLFAWGANNYGQLGLGSFTEQSNYPTEVQLDHDLQPENIKFITGGGGHTIILDDYGGVYGCGLNSANQLSLPHNSNVSKFTKLESLNSYNGSQIACGWDSTFLITNEGYLLTWGSNVYGQLGISKQKAKNVIDPIQLPLSGVVEVSSGLRHTGIVLSNGILLISGQGRKGQLGITAQDGSPITETDGLQHVSELENVQSVACGQNHTIALTKDGKLFAWGDNKHGQLGLNPLNFSQANTPCLITCDVPASTKLYAGWTHSVFHKEDGTIINCGRNLYGQLGSPKDMRIDNWALQNMQFLNSKSHHLAVGSEHNVMLSDDGCVWTWGWNEHGNCGIGNEDNVFVPTQLHFKNRVLLTGSGSAHSFAVVHE